VRNLFSNRLGNDIGRLPVQHRCGKKTPASAFSLLPLWAVWIGLLFWPGPAAFGATASPAELFRDGVTAYRAADYARAAEVFAGAAALRPAAGTLQNLGNAQWQRGQVGPAILAWEQALWLDPFNQAVQGNLRFARKSAQIEGPDLPWYEVVSTWLPANWWACIAGVSLWLAVSLAMLPGILRWRKATWHQAGAALGLALFLLSLPALLGVHTRSRLGFILQSGTPLRLTPTADAQALTRLAAGDPARWERTRGRFVFIRTNHAGGWIEQDQFAVIAR
jgi:hypothetical protein